MHSQLVPKTDRHATWGPWNPSSEWPGPGLLELGLTFKVFAASPKPASHPCNPGSLLTDS